MDLQCECVPMRFVFEEPPPKGSVELTLSPLRCALPNTHIPVQRFSSLTSGRLERFSCAIRTRRTMPKVSQVGPLFSPPRCTHGVAPMELLLPHVLLSPRSFKSSHITIDTSLPQHSFTRLPCSARVKGHVLRSKLFSPRAHRLPPFAHAPQRSFSFVAA